MTTQSLELPITQKIYRLTQSLLQRGRKHGWVSVARLMQRRLNVYRYEARLGINTCGWIGKDSISKNPLCLSYEPFDYETIQLAISKLKIDPVLDGFLDYGAGKGRVMAVAAQFPFKRILGVELSPYLTESANQNMRNLKRRVCQGPIEAVVADACDFEVPADISAIFLFNPFCGEVLDRVVARIEESLDRHPRAVSLVHVHFRSAPSPFARSAKFSLNEELPLICREDMSAELYSSRCD